MNDIITKESAINYLAIDVLESCRKPAPNSALISHVESMFSIAIKSIADEVRNAVEADYE
jgi:hypothetical protein